VLVILIVLSFCVCTGRAAERTEVRMPTSLLVLINGRIISGRIHQSSGGYIVERPNGRLLVPFQQIHIQAIDLRDAYRQLRESVPSPTAGTHVALARWCLTHELFDETRNELRAALEIDPRMTEARDMLRRLEEILNPQNPAHRKHESFKPRTDDGFTFPEPRSLSGLARAPAQQFVTKVQPILMNNCARAGCHSAKARSSFRLERVRTGRGGSRTMTERNLAATLQLIDIKEPDASPLLSIPSGKHGRGGRAIFSGLRGSRQSNILRDWVREVAEARSGAATKSSKQFVDTEGDRPQGTPTWANKGVMPVAAAKFDKSTNTGIGAASGDPLLKAILREERKDAFDPEEFNRQTRRSFRGR